MSNPQAKKLVGFVDPGMVEQPGQNNGNFITKVPGPDKPLIVKCVINPDRGREGYLPMKSFPHMIGPNDQDRRFHPCRTFFGDKQSPEYEALRAAYDERDRLMTSGKSEDSPEVQKQLAIISVFQSKNFGWLYVVEPDSPKVKALKIGQAVINSLFGRKGNSYVKELPSLIKELGAKGLNPYDLTKEEGWLCIYKTGEGMATEYTVRLDEKPVDVIVNGKKLNAMQPVSHKVNEKILEMTTDDLPNPMEFEERNAFTMEEARAFVASVGTKIPDRFVKGSTSQGGAPSLATGPTKLVDAKAPTAAVSLDDIPF